MLRGPKHSKIEVVAPTEEEEVSMDATLVFFNLAMETSKLGAIQ
jgi:hypothetical protein